MKLRKRILALGMAAVMTLGSTMTALAAEGDSGATGTGTNTGHLDTDVVVAVLPTTGSTANIFNFTVDPENILAKADKFTDGTTAAGADFANADLVYFKQAADAEKAFASSSQKVKVAAKNYVDADVSVEVTANDAETNIPLVDSAEALAASETPALLLTVKVGSKTGVLTSSGVTVTDTIAAQDDNFDVKRQDDGSYKVVPNAEVANEDWDGVDVQLTGKVKGGTVAAGVTAPTLELTWTVAKHTSEAAPSIASTTYTAEADTPVEITVNLGAGALAAEGVASVSYLNKSGAAVAVASGSGYSFADGKVTLTAATVNAFMSATATSRVFTITFDDESATEVQVTLNK